MLTTGVLNAAAAFESDFRALFSTDELDALHYQECLQIGLGELAAKALHVSFSVAFVMPTETGRRLACRVMTEKHAILDDIRRLRKSWGVGEALAPQNLVTVFKRVRAAELHKIYSLPSFHSACQEGHQLLMQAREIEAVDFDYNRDKALGKKLHGLARQAFKVATKLLRMAGRCQDVQIRLMGTNDLERLTDSLLSPPIVIEATAENRAELVQESGGRLQLDASRHAYMLMHPEQRNLCLGFVVLSERVHRRAERSWVQVLYLEIASSFQKQSLGRTLLGWVKRNGHENGFDTIWVKKEQASETTGFWHKMKFYDLNGDWLIHGPLRKGSLMLGTA